MWRRPCCRGESRRAGAIQRRAGTYAIQKKTAVIRLSSMVLPQ